jgi:tetratricopeptide (TPR) repeat protein
MNLFNWAGELIGKKKAASDYLASGLESLEADEKAKAEKDLAKAVELGDEEKDWDTIGEACLALGQLYASQENKIRAEEKLRRAVQVFDDSEDFPNLIKAFDSLGTVYMSMHRLVDAEQALRYSMGFNQQLHGAESAKVADSAERLAACFMEKKAFPEAEVLFRHSLAIHEKIADVSGSDVAASLSKLGMCMAEQDKFEEAEQAFKRAIDLLEIRRDELTKDGGVTLCICYHELGRLYHRQEKADLAQATFKKGLAVCDDFPGYLGEGDLVEDHQRCVTSG